MQPDKIQKTLAHAGVGSRRHIEDWIRAGRIMVNGKRAQLGMRISDRDQVTVDGRIIFLKKSRQIKQRVLLYHKAEGEICSRSDPEKRPTIFEHLPVLRDNRWVTVGRLDFNTSGLLLITNDGELANQLMHPRSQLEREYAVRTRGELSLATIKRLEKGVHLSDGLARFNKIVSAGGRNANHWYHVVVKEGRNRLVRRLLEAVDVTVSRLIRIRFGTMVLPPGLPRRKYLELSAEEIAKLAT